MAIILSYISPVNRGQMIFIILCLVSILKLGYTAIVVSPKDAETAIGATVIFNCSSSIPGTDVQWNVIPIGTPMQVIYAYGKINGLYLNRFTVQNGHNLHVSSVVEGDAGTYECVDDYGKGEKRSAELIILGTPSCSSNLDTNEIVGKNVCGFEPDQVSLSCIVQFQGRKAPTMEWKKNGEEKTITSGVRNVTQGNMAMLNLTMKGDSIENGSRYSCSPAYVTSTAMTCDSGTFTVKGESNSIAESSCQDRTGFINYNYIALLIIILLFQTPASAAIWYLLIQRTQHMSKAGQGGPESEPLRNEKHRRRSTCKCSKDAIIFVLLMAIPFGIGLLLWYLCAYRNAEKKSNKGPNNTDELATFLNRTRKMKEMQETINGLLSEKKSLENENMILKKEKESAHKENEKLRKENASSKKTNDDLNSAIQCVKKTNDNLNSTIKGLNMTNENLNGTNGRLTKINDNLSGTMEEVKKAYGNLNGTIEDLKKTNRNLNSVNEDLKKEIERLKKEKKVPA